jgi:protein-tyrosine phosphatase
MIDLHNHLLPGLDDGAKDLEESVKMCWISYKDGVRTIVATPHTLNGVYRNDRDNILLKVNELNSVLKRIAFDSDLNVPNGPNGLNELNELNENNEPNDPNGLNRPNASAPSRISASTHLRIDALRILPGADVHLTEKTLSFLDEGKLMTVGDGKKYLFIEFPYQGVPYRVEEVLFQLMSRGVIPIITHPERNLEIGQRPQRYYEMIKMGCLGQVTAMSLTGEFGLRMRQVGERLLKNRLIHFIASDAHSTNGRPPILSEGVRAAERIVGEGEAWKMVTEYPQAVLEGLKPKFPSPLRP